MAKQKTEQEKRYFLYGQRPHFSGLSNVEKDKLLAEYLVARIGSTKAAELIAKTADAYATKRATKKLIGDYDLECRMLSKNYIPEEWSK